MKLPHPTLVTLLLFFFASVVHAEPTAAEKQMAEGLFQDAKKLYAAGKVAEACTKYEESQKIAPGGGTILSLAICREDEEKLATALVLFQEALAKAKSAKRTDREKTASEHIAALETKISKVTVTVAGEVDGLEVKLDSTNVPRAAWGTEVPVDPGAHTIAASAPGKKTWTTSITIGAVADRKTVLVPKLEGVTKEPPPIPIVAPTATISTKPTDAPQAPSTPPNDATPGSTRTIGLVVGSVGAALLGAGAYFALRAGSLKDDAATLDASGDFAGADAKTSDARSAQTFARIGVGVGVAALATGVVLFVISPSSSNKTASVQVAPLVGASAGGLTLLGRF